MVGVDRQPEGGSRRPGDPGVDRFDRLRGNAARRAASGLQELALDREASRRPANGEQIEECCALVVELAIGTDPRIAECALVQDAGEQNAEGFAHRFVAQEPELQVERAIGVRERERRSQRPHERLGVQNAAEQPADHLHLVRNPDRFGAHPDLPSGSRHQIEMDPALGGEIEAEATLDHRPRELQLAPRREVPVEELGPPNRLEIVFPGVAGRDLGEPLEEPGEELSGAGGGALEEGLRLPGEHRVRRLAIAVEERARALLRRQAGPGLAGDPEALAGERRQLLGGQAGERPVGRGAGSAIGGRPPEREQIRGTSAVPDRRPPTARSAR